MRADERACVNQLMDLPAFSTPSSRGSDGEAAKILGAILRREVGRNAELYERKEDSVHTSILI